MPSVTLIDYTGHGNPDPDYAAKLLIYTKNTRLTQGADTRAKVNVLTKQQIANELAEIVMTVRSSWEFVNYVFEVKGVTRAYTHQAVRTRTASYAQQAQRVADMSGFETRLPESVKEIKDGEQDWLLLMEHIDAVYRRYIDAGVPAQDARGVLPTNVLTNIIIGMNLRTLAETVGKRDNLRAQDEYTEVIKQMAQAVIAVHPWTENFLYPERTNTPVLNEMLAVALDGASPVSKPKLNSALKELDMLKATWG